MRITRKRVFLSSITIYVVSYRGCIELLSFRTFNARAIPNTASKRGSYVRRIKTSNAIQVMLRKIMNHSILYNEYLNYKYKDSPCIQYSCHSIIQTTNPFVSTSLSSGVLPTKF